MGALLGWRVCNCGTPAGGGVMIAYPHRSNRVLVIAFLANRAIGLANFNFTRKRIGVTTFRQPSGDANADRPQIARWYADHAVGRHPDLAAPLRLKRRSP